MKILSIDTSSNACSVAILEDKKVIKEITNEDGNTHSVKLMPQIEQIFKETNLNLKDIDLLVCDKGPGSFTGIRIGISTIKAFCDVTNSKGIGISSLLALAYNSDFKGYICSLIDAKNDNAYYALFDNTDGKYKKLDEYCCKNINSITEILKVCNKPIFFVGNGSIVYKDMLESGLKENAIFASNEKSNKLSATNLGIAAFDVISSDLYSEDFNLSPLYLRPSNAERELMEKQNGNK